MAFKRSISKWNTKITRTMFQLFKCAYLVRFRTYFFHLKYPHLGWKNAYETSKPHLNSKNYFPLLLNGSFPRLSATHPALCKVPLGMSTLPAAHFCSPRPARCCCCSHKGLISQWDAPRSILLISHHWLLHAHCSPCSWSTCTCPRCWAPASQRHVVPAAGFVPCSLHPSLAINVVSGHNGSLHSHLQGWQRCFSHPAEDTGECSWHNSPESERTWSQSVPESCWPREVGVQRRDTEQPFPFLGLAMKPWD